MKKDEELAKNPPLEEEKKLDLSFKEGQTIKINIGKKSEASSVERQKPKSTNMSGGMGILLPPPPRSKQLQQTSTASSTASSESSSHSQFQSTTMSASASTKTADNLLLDFD